MPASNGVDPGRWGWWLLVPMVAAAFTRDFWTPDEPRYAEVARHAWEEGGLLVMHLCGKLYPDKPPLVFWTAGLLGSLSGWSEGVMRLVSLASTAGTAALISGMACRWWGRAAAHWSLIAFLGSFFVYKHGDRLQIDPLLMLTCTAALALLDQARDGRANRRVLAAGLITGLGVLTKGPVALVNVGLPLLAWWGIVRPAALLGVSTSSRVGALLLALLPAGLWATLASLAEPSMTEELFFKQHIGRTIQGTAHSAPFWDHLLAVPVLFLPWTHQALVALGVWWRERTTSKHGRPVNLGLLRCGWWFMGLFVFFSIIPVKRDLYLLPAYPALALLAGWSLARTNTVPRWTRRLATLALGGIGSVLALAAVLATLRPDIHPWATTMDGLAWRCGVLAPVFLVGAWHGMRAARRGLAAWARSYVMSWSLGWTLVALLLFPAINPVKSERSTAEFLAARPERPTSILCKGTKPDGYAFYGRVPAVRLEADWPLAATLAQSRAREGDEFLAVIESSAFEQLTPDERDAYVILHRSWEESDLILVIGGAAADEPEERVGSTIGELEPDS